MENPFKKAVQDTKENIENKTEDNSTVSENTPAEEQNAANKKDEKNNNPEDKKEEKKTPLQELQEKYDALDNQYLRLAADFDNFRKRNAQEREALLKYGAESTLKKMLEVLDNFERGLKAIENVDDAEKVKECFKLAYKNFTDVLKKAGLETIKAEGEDFDPNFHEAVMRTPSDDHEENTIIAELQKGYKLGDKVLRPTLVNVATKDN